MWKSMEKSISRLRKSLSNLLDKEYWLEHLKPLLPVRKEENKTTAWDIQDQPRILFIWFPSASASYVPTSVGIYAVQEGWLRGVSAVSKFLSQAFWGQLLSPCVLLWHQASRMTEHLYNWSYSQVGHGTCSVLDLKSTNITAFETKITQVTSSVFQTLSPSVGRSQYLRLVQFLHLKQHRVKALHREAHIFLHHTQRNLSHRRHKRLQMHRVAT